VRAGDAMSETTTKPEAAQGESTPSSAKGGWRKPVVIAVKVLISAVILGLIYQATLKRDGADEMLRQLGELSWGWYAAAVTMQLAAITCGIVRWRRLLGGQGIHAPWSFLASSWMIGRFWGAVTPGGLGLDGWRLYETA